jgi:hypothetical protein
VTDWKARAVLGFWFWCAASFFWQAVAACLHWLHLERWQKAALSKAALSSMTAMLLSCDDSTEVQIMTTHLERHVNGDEMALDELRARMDRWRHD